MGLAVPSLVIGVVMLFAVRQVDWVVFLLPLWVAMVSILILLREPSGPGTATSR